MRDTLAEAAAINGSDRKGRKMYKAIFPGLIDIVQHEGKPFYLVKADDELNMWESVELGEETYYPPTLEQITWLLPHYDKVAEEYKKYLEPTDEAETKPHVRLFDELLEYHKGISELPDDRFYNLITAWDFHTYRQEEAAYTPIWSLFATPERGKSRTGNAMVHVAYRGVSYVSVREAFVFRHAEHCGGAMFFDIRDFTKSVEKAGSDDIFLARFEKGLKVPRITDPKLGPFRDTTNFNVFGPTVLGTNTELEDILGTRCIHVTMQDSDKEFERSVKPEDGLAFRERLVAYRAYFIDKPLPDTRKPAKRRFGDITRPLAQMIEHIKPELSTEVITFIEELQGHVTARKYDSLEADVIKIVLQLENALIDGKLAIQTITDTLNYGIPDNRHYGVKRIGSTLKALGLREGKPQRISDGKTAIDWNENEPKLIKLAFQYGVLTEDELKMRQEVMAEKDRRTQNISSAASESSENGTLGIPVADRSIENEANEATEAEKQVRLHSNYPTESTYPGGTGDGHQCQYTIEAYSSYRCEVCGEFKPKEKVEDTLNQPIENILL